MSTRTVIDQLRIALRDRPRPFQVADRSAAGFRPVARRFLDAAVDIDRLVASGVGYIRFARSLQAYRSLPGAEEIDGWSLFPQLHDATMKSPYDPHYLHQDTWAARHIAEFAPARHFDVGSRVDLVAFLTALTEVEFVDFRPLDAPIEGLTPVGASILNLPYPDRSIASLSCLNVAEHIGLGRYGDPLDPAGMEKAMRELQRVLAPGGQLLFAVPVGTRRVVFNAHRIRPPTSVISAFDELDLVEFSGVDDAGTFRRFCDPAEFEDARYALGLFRFRRSVDDGRPVEGT